MEGAVSVRRLMQCSRGEWTIPLVRCAMGPELDGYFQYLVREQA